MKKHDNILQYILIFLQHNGNIIIKKINTYLLKHWIRGKILLHGRLENLELVVQPANN